MPLAVVAAVVVVLGRPDCEATGESGERGELGRCRFRIDGDNNGAAAADDDDAKVDEEDEKDNDDDDDEDDDDAAA